MPIRVAAMTALVLLAMLVKTVVLPHIALGFYRPDVVVMVVAAVALLEGTDTGLRLGFGAGLAQDLVSGGAALVGVGAIVLMAVGYGAGRLKPFIVSAPRSGTVVVVGTAAAAATFGSGMLGRFLGTVSVGVPTVVAATITVGLYSALLSPLVATPAQKLMKQFPAASR